MGSERSRRTAKESADSQKIRYLCPSVRVARLNTDGMNNNDIFKKLRVALQLRDDQIVEILQLVDFRISKGEIGNFFRNEDHPKYMDCGDQVLRNFLNGLIIHLRGTKDSPKNPKIELDNNKAALKDASKGIAPNRTASMEATAKKPAKNFTRDKKPKTSPVEKVKFTIKKKP